MAARTAHRVTLRVVGLIGLAIFVTFFSFTFAIPDWIEEFGADFIEREASRSLEDAVDDWRPPPGGSALSTLAESLYEANQERIDELKSKLKAQVSERMAAALAEIRDLDCECRQKWAEHFRNGFQFELEMLQTANDRIVDFIHSTYMKVLAELRRDVRIFTGTNAIVFFLLLVVSVARPEAIAHLFLPAALLVIATAITSYFYIFQQNWLLTIIYSDYVGFMYLGYLGLVFAILCDIVLNRARITTAIINGILEAIGSAASLTPC